MNEKEINDIQAFINIFFPFAEELLIKYGEFRPYAGATTTNGEFVSVGNHENDVTRDSSEVISTLKSALRDGSADYLLAGVFYEVRTKDNETGEVSDAIAVFIEHRDSHSAYQFFYPYKIEQDSKFNVEDSYGNVVEKEIFPGAPEEAK